MLSEEEIEKAKERLVKQAVTNNVDCEDYPNCICMKKDLIIVLNYIEQLEQENNKLNKMIDEMAKELNKAYFYEKDFYIWFEENIINEKTGCLSNRTECIKRYFKEKVEEK